jgi:glutamyl-Q tRNA(Asp) synthetase
MDTTDALRINLDMALGRFDRIDTLSFEETGDVTQNEPTRIHFRPEDLKTQVGDFIVSRREFLGSYHLSVVLDDAAQGVTHVIRGPDIFEATNIHVFLQSLLGLKTPIYHHHRLIRDEQGKRLAKRDDARAIAKYRAEGATPADIRRMVGLA